MRCLWLSQAEYIEWRLENGYVDILRCSHDSVLYSKVRIDEVRKGTEVESYPEVWC